MEIFECHKKDLAEIYGKFEEYKSFRKIIEIEYQRWLTTDAQATQKVQQLIKKKKGKLTVDDWIVAMKSYGLSPDKISEVSKLPIPDNLYTKLSDLEEQHVKVLPKMLYLTQAMEATEELFYEDGNLRNFDSEIQTIMEVVDDNGKGTGKYSIVVLKKTAFYPLGGGQDNDLGKLTIEGKVYNILKVEKVGKVILHFIDGELDSNKNYSGIICHGEVDDQRRNQLRNHHTATHIVCQSARQVLGPHIWQHGAKKTVEEAHLDITHYASLTYEEEAEIERLANETIRKAIKVNKFVLSKEEAEKQYGFKLYQGGVVAGNTVRIVDIDNFDTEACCGTHCDNTSEIGLIRILRSNRISDGIVRIRFVAGDAAYKHMTKENKLVNDICEMWSVQPENVLSTADRFFTGYKKLTESNKKMLAQIIELQVKCITQGDVKLNIINSDSNDPTNFISVLPTHVKDLKEHNKSIIVIGDGFIYGVVNESDYNCEGLQNVLESSKKSGEKKKAMPFRMNKNMKAKSGKGKKPEVISGMIEVTGSYGNKQQVVDYLKTNGFVLFN